MRDTSPRRQTGASILAVFLDSQNWSPVDVSDLVVLLDSFPKVGKTTRTVGHSFTCTSDLYRRRVRLSRLCLSAGRAVPGLTALGPAGPDRTWPCGRAGPGRAGPGRAGPGRAGPGRAGPGRAGPGRAGPGRAGPGRAGPGRPGQLPAPGRVSERVRREGFGAYDRAGLRRATGGRASERDQASAHTTGPGFGTPLAQLIPRRRIGLCRRFPRFLQLSPC